MKFEDLKNMAEKDCVIDNINIDNEALRTPQLHNKYLNLYHDYRLMLKKARAERSVLYKKKWEYYSGKLDEDELKKLGWEPFQYKILRQDLDVYLNSDEDLQKIDTQIIMLEEKVEYLESVIKNIMNRQWYIRSFIDWRKFTSGVV